MASRSYNNYSSLRSMPKPVSLDIPGLRNGTSGTRRREARPLPRFDDDDYGGKIRERDRHPDYYDSGYDDGYRAYESESGRKPARSMDVRQMQNQASPYDSLSPQMRERSAYADRPQGSRADGQRRRRPNQGGNPGGRRRQPVKRRETPMRKGLLALSGINFSFKVNPLYRHIAIVVTGLVTIIAVAFILISNAFADNALAVLVDGQHVGYIELTAGWSSEAFHEDAIMELQGRRGVGVNVDQVVTLEPARASQSDIVTRSNMLSQIANNYFSYKFSAVAIYAFNPLYGRYNREAIMRSMADVYSAKYLLTQRFQTANTVYYGFYPDWRLVPVEVDDDDVLFHTPQEAFARLDRRIRQYVNYDVRSGDTLIGIARAWDMEIGELVRVNNLSAATPIHPGQQLWVVTQAPLLSVITIEETSRVETLERPVERVYVTTLLPAVTRVRQDGNDGEHTVITRTTRRGMMVIDEEEFYGEVIIEAVPMIVEVGEAR